jgi:hypothetical protein
MSAAAAAEALASIVIAEASLAALDLALAYYTSVNEYVNEYVDDGETEGEMRRVETFGGGDRQTIPYMGWKGMTSFGIDKVAA